MPSWCVLEGQAFGPFSAAFPGTSAGTLYQIGALRIEPEPRWHNGATGGE